MLLLDEITNDLDIFTLQSLEEGLKNYRGSFFLISHDRWFLEKVCNVIIEIEDLEEQVPQGREGDNNEELSTQLLSKSNVKIYRGTLEERNIIRQLENRK